MIWSHKKTKHKNPLPGIILHRLYQVGWTSTVQRLQSASAKGARGSGRELNSELRQMPLAASLQVPLPTPLPGYPAPGACVSPLTCNVAGPAASPWTHYQP